MSKKYTLEQRKQAMDLIIKALIDNKEGLGTKELIKIIYDNLNIELNPQSVGSLISLSSYGKNRSPYYCIVNDVSDNRMKYVLTPIINKFHKEKTIVYGSTYDEEIPIYDYNTNTRLINSKQYKLYSVNCGNKLSSIINDAIKQTNDFVPEWVFSYEDVFKNITLNATYITPNLHKGTIQAYKELQCNELKQLNDINLIIENNVKPTRSLLKALAPHDNCLKMVVIKYPQLINKIMISTLKEGEYRVTGLDILNLIRDFQDINKVDKIDSNRSYSKNKVILHRVANEEKYTILSNNLQKLNFINNLEIGDYVIKVPQNIEDLIDEGKQQNNCVGSNYNTSIVRGENLIYFIRKKDNINKSYVTCRYNIDGKATYEHKIKNNQPYNDEVLINQIDNIIRQHI